MSSSAPDNLESALDDLEKFEKARDFTLEFTEDSAVHTGRALEHRGNKPTNENNGFSFDFPPLGEDFSRASQDKQTIAETEPKLTSPVVIPLTPKM